MARKTEKIKKVPMACTCGVEMEICKDYEAWCARSQGADYSQGQLYCTKCCDEWPGSRHYTPAKIKEHCFCLHKWQRGHDEGFLSTRTSESSSGVSSFQIIPSPPPDPNNDVMWQRILGLESQIEGLTDKLNGILHHLWDGYQ